jgi:hypothetical protein
VVVVQVVTHTQHRQLIKWVMLAIIQFSVQSHLLAEVMVEKVVITDLVQ